MSSDRRLDSVWVSIVRQRAYAQNVLLIAFEPAEPVEVVWILGHCDVGREVRRAEISYAELERLVAPLRGLAAVPEGEVALAFGLPITTVRLEWTDGVETTFSWWGEPPGGWQPLTPFVERVLALGEQGAVDDGELRPSSFDAVRGVHDRESFRAFLKALAADLEARAVASPPSAAPDAVELLARLRSRLAPQIQHETDPWRALAYALRSACENDEPQRAQKPS